MLDASLVKTWRAATLAVVALVFIGCTQIKVETQGASPEPTSINGIDKAAEHDSEDLIH